MNTSDVPHLKEQTMATSTNDPGDRADATGVESATANPGEKRSTPVARKATVAKRDLASASESSDPAVHQVIAELDIARQNGDEQAVKNAEDRLAELGFK